MRAAALGAQRMGFLVLSDMLAALERLAALLAAILIGRHVGILHGKQGGAQFEVIGCSTPRVFETAAPWKIGVVNARSHATTDNRQDAICRCTVVARATQSQIRLLSPKAR